MKRSRGPANLNQTGNIDGEKRNLLQVTRITLPTNDFKEMTPLQLFNVYLT